MSRLVNIRSQWNTQNAKVRPGQQMYTYKAGTVSPQATYTDPELTIPHANPVIADSTGTFPEIFLANIGYKLRLLDAKDVQYDEIDDVYGLPSPDEETFSPIVNAVDVFTATAGQTLFALTNGSYIIGDNSLMVFVNGVYQYTPDDYAETSTSSFTTTFSIEEGDVVVAITSVKVTTQVEFAASDGSAVSPSFRFSDDADTGLYSDSSDILGITTGGSERVLVANARVSSLVPLNLPQYDVAGSGALTPSTGDVIYVSDGDTGSPCLAVYDGSSFKRVALGATIST